MRNSVKVTKVPWRDYRHKLMPFIQRTEKINGHIFADQIDKALSEDKAFLFIAPEGFLVLQPTFLDKKEYVIVLFAFSFTSHNMLKYQPVIEELTLDLGAHGVVLYTVLKTVVRACLRLGYKQSSVDDSNIIRLIKEF